MLHIRSQNLFISHNWTFVTFDQHFSSSPRIFIDDVATAFVIYWLHSRNYKLGMVSMS